MTSPESAQAVAAWRMRALLAIAAFALGAGVALCRQQSGGADFYVLWGAARHWQTPYDPAVISSLPFAPDDPSLWPFAYPPTFLLLAWPFGQLPLAAAYPMWAGLSGALFVTVASFVVKRVWMAGLLLVSPPVLFAIMPGQTTLMLGSAMLGGWILRDRRPVAAGLLFAVAACIKPQAMILAPIVFWGRWRLAWAMLAGGLGLCLLSLVFGPERWVEWVAAVRSFREVMPGTNRINPSALLASPLWGAALVGLGGYIAWRTRDLSGLVVGALCCTPYAHGYDLTPLAPVALVWAVGWRNAGWPLGLLGAALFVGLISTPLASLALALGLAAVRTPWPLPRTKEAPANRGFLKASELGRGGASYEA